MINKLGRQLIALLTITALILPSFAYAQTQKTPAQRLEETRKDDRRQCEAEVQSGTPSFGQAVADQVTKPLKDAIGEEAGKAEPKAVNSALATGIPAEIQSGIQKEIPDIVTEGLKRELPQTLGDQIKAEMAKNDLTFQQVVQDQNRFTGLVNASIKESLPRIIQDGLNDRLPNIIDGSIRVAVPNALRLEFNKVAQPTIENHYRAQIETLITKIPGMVRDEIQNLQATIKGTIAGLRAAITNLTTSGDMVGRIFDLLAAGQTLLSGGSLQDAANAIPEVAQITALIKNLTAQIKATGDFIKWANELMKPENQKKLVDNLVNGFAVELSKTLTDPKAIARLADTIGNAMTDPVNRSLANATDRIAGSIQGPLNDAINGVNGLPKKLFAPINAALTDVSKLANLEIETVVHAVTNPITSTIDVVSKNLAQQIDAGLKGVLTPIVGGASEFLGSVGGQIASDLRFGAMETHLAIFGSEGLFVDETVGQPVWPTNTYGADGSVYPEPPTYFPAPGEAGFNGPVVPFTEVGPPNEAIGEVTPPLDLTPVGPLADATEELATGAADTTIAATETVTTDAVTKTGVDAGLNPLSGASLVPAVAASATGLITGLLKTGIAPVDAVIAMAVTKGVELVSAAAGLGAATAAALAVPVNEIGALLTVNTNTDQTTTKILQTNQEIKAMTEKILSLQVQACTHLKVIQRVQLALETKELLNDPNAFKANAAALGKAKDDFINNKLNQGRQLSEGETGVSDPQNQNKGPLWVRDYTSYINDAGQEAKLVAQDQLVQLAKSDPEKYSDLKIINDSLAAEGNADEFANTIPKERLEKFRNDPVSLSNADWWGTFTDLGENNIFTRKLKADEFINQQVAARQAAAAAEYNAGNGYLGTRECIATTADGKSCAKWQILTPGSTIGDRTNRLLAASLDHTIANGELETDSTKSQVLLDNILSTNLSNISQTTKYSDNAQQSVFAGPDPCPGPGPCPQTGWPRQTSRPNTSGGGNSSGSSGGSGNSGGFPISNFPASSAGTQPPSVAFGLDLSNPTVAEITAGTRKNETIINWQSSDADTCAAGNDWVSGSVGHNVEKEGDDVKKRGSITITHPINFQNNIAPRFSQIVAATGVTKIIPTDPKIADDQLAYKLTFNPVNGAGINVGDIYQLRLIAGTLTVGPVVGGATAKEVIDLFQTAISNESERHTALGQELDRYSIGYIKDEAKGTGYIKMSPKLLYQITCTASNKEPINQEFTLTRKLQ